MKTRLSLLVFAIFGFGPAALAAQEITAVFERASAEVFSRPHDLVLAPDKGLLYLADVGNDRVQVLDPVSLDLLGAIGKDELDSPHDVAFDAAGRLLVADSGNDRIAVYEVAGTGGKLLEFWGGLDSPEGVVAAKGGLVYVTNASDHDVVAFSKGKPVARAGTRGGGPNQYVRPHDIDLDPMGRLHVSDPGNDRIQVLGRDLAVTATVGGPGFDFNEPKYFAFDPAGRLYVADEYNHQIKIFDPDRRLLAVIGNGARGKGPGRFNQPEGITVWQNTLWISDTRNNRVVRYRMTGMP